MLLQPSLNYYSLILLDLDDTLLDFGASQQSAFDRTLANFGIDRSTELFSQFKIINSELWALYEKALVSKRDVFSMRWQRLLDPLGVSSDPMTVNQNFLEELATHPVWLAGAEEFCKELAQNYKLVLVTNGDAVTQRLRVQRAGLENLIEHIVISDDVGFAKPHPKIFEHALAAVKFTEKSKVLMIGDNFHADIAGAINFGIDACWYNPASLTPIGDIAATFEARAHSEISTWLSGQGAPSR